MYNNACYAEKLFAFLSADQIATMASGLSLLCNLNKTSSVFYNEIYIHFSPRCHPCAYEAGILLEKTQTLVDAEIFTVDDNEAKLVLEKKSGHGKSLAISAILNNTILDCYRAFHPNGTILIIGDSLSIFPRSYTGLGKLHSFRKSCLYYRDRFKYSYAIDPIRIDYARISTSVSILSSFYSNYIAKNDAIGDALLSTDIIIALPFITVKRAFIWSIIVLSYEFIRSACARLGLLKAISRYKPKLRHYSYILISPFYVFLRIMASAKSAIIAKFINLSDFTSFKYILSRLPWRISFKFKEYFLNTIRKHRVSLVSKYEYTNLPDCLSAAAQETFRFMSERTISYPEIRVTLKLHPKNYEERNDIKEYAMHRLKSHLIRSSNYINLTVDESDVPLEYIAKYLASKPSNTEPIPLVIGFGSNMIYPFIIGESSARFKIVLASLAYNQLRFGRNLFRLISSTERRRTRHIRNILSLIDISKIQVT